ncbi:hypothetical protein M5689_001751 [Euphorbia peplus]|nr:hypothetical protein M5689_001751 [Euphorbia peplus]
MGKRGKKSRKKWIKHYSNFQNILLVGEGDFGFALSLANAFGSASNIVATSLDSKGKVKEKYPLGEMNLEELEDLGCTIIHGVDAHTMSKHPLLLDLQPFERIVFNYPHARIHDDIIHESSPSQIKIHQKLVRGFLTNAYEMLSIDGQVHVTHKTTYPFTEWGIENIAQEVGLQLIEEDEFDKWDYPGYHNRKGYGSRCNKSFPVGQSSTFKFAL